MATIRGYSCTYQSELNRYHIEPIDKTLTTCQELPTKAELESLGWNLSRELLIIFNDCRNVVSLPEIPIGPTNMNLLFANCSNLEHLPQLPSGLTWISGSYCSKLKTVPELPPTIYHIGFQGCGIESFPVIPANVTSLHWAFMKCYELEGKIEIMASNIINYDDCFKSTKKPIALVGSCPQLSDIAATGDNGNVYVFTPPSPEPSWTTPVINRADGSRTTYADMNRIANNIYLLGGYPRKMGYASTDFVMDNEWNVVLYYTNKFADELGIQRATESTSYTNLNRIENIHKLYHESLSE